MRAFYHRFMRGICISVPRVPGASLLYSSIVANLSQNFNTNTQKNHQKLTTPTCTKEQEKVPYCDYGTILTYFFAFVNRVIVNITEKFL